MAGQSASEGKVLQQLQKELRSKDVAIETLERQLQVSKEEAEGLQQRVVDMEQEKHKKEMEMVLLQEEASQSLRSMVEAQQERKRMEEVYRERLNQLEVQVASQAEELRHLRMQLLEETQAHRDDVEESERISQRKLKLLRVELKQARGMAKSASINDLPSQIPVSPGLTPTVPQRRLLKTVSEDPPPFHTLPPPYHTNAVGLISYSLPRSSFQKAPATFHTGVSTFQGHLCYFSSFMTNQIHVYDTAVGAWHQLPDCPVSNFGLEIVGGLVTTIGGRLATATEASSSVCTNQLLSLRGEGSGERGREGRWVERVPAMVLARAQAATASNSRLVIVAGGEVGDYKSFIADIEVLVVDTGQWSRLASSPLGDYSWLSAIVCGDQLYLVEGQGSREKDRLHSLHLGALLEGIRDQPTTRTRKTSTSGLPWKRVKPPPASNTTCVSAKGKLIAVGGIDVNGKTTNDIWALNESSERWKTIGSLKSYRYRSLVGVTAIGSLLVIGGLTKTTLTDQMEVFDSF